jgi:3-deoxy-D-manno-octulosonate 8-phosphate phosphatase (KDO 8-P phosphatase)
VLGKAMWVSGENGGAGAVRQLCEGLILANYGWDAIVTQAYGVSPQDCGW